MSASHAFICAEQNVSMHWVKFPTVGAASSPCLAHDQPDAGRLDASKQSACTPSLEVHLPMSGRDRADVGPRSGRAQCRDRAEVSAGVVSGAHQLQLPKSRHASCVYEL